MITYQGLGKYGRIGNQMFEISGTIGLATKHGYDYAFPYWQNYDQLERFGGGEDIDIQKWFKNPLPLLPEGFQQKRDVQIPWGYHDIQIHDRSNLIGHMQSEKYFLHCKDKIKEYFTFKHETKKQVDTVAVHFRGGDYGGDYHPTLTREYYEKAASYFESGFTFVLFTDDPQRAREVMPFDFKLIEGNHSMVDMELMSKCDAHIIANSTFSWWGAWLADSRRVIAPARWFGPAASKLETKDIIPETWIKI